MKMNFFELMLHARTVDRPILKITARVKMNFLSQEAPCYRNVESISKNYLILTHPTKKSSCIRTLVSLRANVLIRFRGSLRKFTLRIRTEEETIPFSFIMFFGLIFPSQVKGHVMTKKRTGHIFHALKTVTAKIGCIF